MREVRKSILRAEAPTRRLSRHRYIEYIYAELKEKTKDVVIRQQGNQTCKFRGQQNRESGTNASLADLMYYSHPTKVSVWPWWRIHLHRLANYNDEDCLKT